MPATLKPIDPALFRNLKSGDERALERLFREQYSELVAEGIPLLDGDGASAARGIEHVFTQLWKDRENISTPEALETYLHEALHEATARISSRHAVAHHLGDFGGSHAQKVMPKSAPVVDDAWSAVSGALHVDAAHVAEIAHQAADHSRHEAATHLAQMAKPRPRGPMIAMALLFIATIAGFALWMNRESEDAILTARLNAPDARVMTTGNAQYSNVTLAEQSTVKLGPASKLVVPRGFGPSVRALRLEGTATFAVAPGQQRPFTVRAGNVSIVATGTSFTVRAYPGEPDVIVSVGNGEVTVTAGDSARPLAGGAAILIAADGAMRELGAAEIEQIVGWADGIVVAIDRPLREIVALARQWFALDLFVADTALLDRKVTLRAPIESGKAAIASIETSGRLEMVWKGSNMVLRARR
jgi:ferric-dicitrate binding protein FerR (iron transport regulator)